VKIDGQEAEVINQTHKATHSLLSLDFDDTPIDSYTSFLYVRHAGFSCRCYVICLWHIIDAIIEWSILSVALAISL